MLHVLAHSFPTRPSSELPAKANSGHLTGRLRVRGKRWSDGHDLHFLIDIDTAAGQPIAQHIVMAGIAMNHAHANLGAFLRPGRNNGCKALSRFHRAGKPRLSARSASGERRSEEHTSELQSLMRHSYAVFCLKKKIKYK